MAQANYTQDDVDRVLWGNSFLQDLPDLHHPESYDPAERLIMRLRRCGLRHVFINSRGNCVPRTLSHQLFTKKARYYRRRTTRFHRRIRRAVVSQLRVHSHLYKGTRTDEEYATYCDTLEQDRAFCDFIFMRAASDLFCVRIIDIGSCIGYEKHETVPHNRRFKRTITVCTTIPGQHIDSLVPANEPAFFTPLMRRIGRRCARTFYSYYTSHEKDWEKMCEDLLQ